MAIARGNTTSWTSAAGTTVTESFDSGSTGSNRYLVVSFAFVNTSTSEVLTGVTYNGVAMTQLFKRQQTTVSIGRWEYIYGLANPATGANNLVASFSSSSGPRWSATVYTGAKQTSQPDATGSGTKTGGGTLALSITTTVDGTYLVGASEDDTGSATAGSGTNRIDTFGAGSGQATWDGTGTVSAGSNALNISLSVSANGEGLLVALAPVASAVVASPISNLALMGVG